MKIVHLLGWYFPDSVGGTEVYVEGLCRRQQGAGHEVLIGAPNPRLTAPEQYTHHGAGVFRYPVDAHPNRDESYHRVPMQGSAHLVRWLASERPDILHVHSIKTGLGLPELRQARRLGLRIIVTCHLPSLGYLCRTGELMQNDKHPCDGVVWPSKCAACSLTHVGLPPILSRIAGAIPPRIGTALRGFPGNLGTVLGMSALVVEYQAMQRELFEIADRVVVLNETAYNMLRADGSPTEKLAINRLGVSQVGMLRKPGPEECPTKKPVRFGFAGRLHPTKGLTQIARAAIAIPSAIDFRLTIRAAVLDEGSRATELELHRLIGRDPRVRFEPPIPSSEMPAALSQLDVLLSPSLWFENGPTIALEAMAVGTPIIATRVGNQAELIQDGVNGRLVEAGNVDQLSAAMVAAATSPQTTIDVWRRALGRVRTMDDISSDYFAMYAEPAVIRTGSL